MPQTARLARRPAPPTGSTGHVRFEAACAPGGMAGMGAKRPKAEWQPVDAGAQTPAIRRRPFVTFDKPQEQQRSNERATAWNGGVR